MIRDIWFSLPLWLQVVCLSLVCMWLYQLFFLFVVRLRPWWQSRREARGRVALANDLPAISIIVYTHNQAADLQENLPRLLDCDYPDFEVIVVDDGSTDETEDILTQMDQRSEHFFHTTMAERISTVSRRKLAMLLGVKAAHNDIVLMTQAQCIPASRGWLAAMGKLFVPGIDAVMGPVVYENRIGLKNKLIQWDFFDRTLSMMGLTLAIKTYGGWHYNLAFRKEVFFANKNYAIQHHLDIQPGEDDLFLADVTSRRNVTVACSADAVVVNRESDVTYMWKRERLRRAFTARFYFLIPSLLKHFDSVTRVLMAIVALAVIIAAIQLQSWWVAGLAALLVLLHATAYALIPYYTARRLGVHRYVWTPLLYSLAAPWVNLYFRYRADTAKHQFYVGRI